MKDLASANLDKMTPAEFEEYLPELFESGGGSISKDPRFANFFKANPDCAALVRDLETIAEQAKSLFEPSGEPAPNPATPSGPTSPASSKTNHPPKQN